MRYRLASVISFCALTLAVTWGLGVDAPQLTAAPSGEPMEFVYLPIVSRPSSLYITNLEVSQAIQDEENGLPLVANRPAVVRVYTATIDGQNVPNTSITLTATRGGSSLTPVTSAIQTASASSSRSVLGSTFNVTLPGDWLSGTVEIKAAVTGQSGGGLVETVTFNAVPTLNVVLVPIDYTHTGTGGGFYAGPSADHISDWMMRAYPLSNLNVTFRAAYPFSGNLRTGDSWEQLLDEVTALKSSDGGPSSTVYYAYVDFDCGWFDCTNGGIAGIGWIGTRASAGLDFGPSDTTGELAGHEIGHNFGRYHAPCGVSGSNWSTDPKHAGASIGEFGLDEIGGNLQLLNPGGTVDMMSYCEPVWISDFTYGALYTDQVANGAFIWTPTQESLLIRGSVGGNGKVTLDPVYILPQTAVSPKNPLYQAELLNDAGQVIATHPVDLLLAEEEGVTARSVFGVVPLPDVPVAEVRLVEVASHTAVANRTLSTAGLAVQASLDQSHDRATLGWGAADVPATLRYSANGGLTWTTVGLNVLGGSLEVDLSDLPGGGSGTFQIILADQGRPNRLDLDLPAPLPDRQPKTWISGPDVVSFGSPAALYAFGSDPEDGALTEFAWLVDGQPKTVGSVFFLGDLAVGDHVITLRATTGSGQSVMANKAVTVTP